MTPLNKTVARVTREPFFSYGPDRGRRFVAALEPGDLLTLRPLRSKESRKVAVKLGDVYRWVLQCQVNLKRLERAREIKARKAEAKKQRRLARDVAKLGL